MTPQLKRAIALEAVTRMVADTAFKGPCLTPLARCSSRWPSVPFQKLPAEMFCLECKVWWYTEMAAIKATELREWAARREP